jgi:hypothetical protein
MSQIMIPGVSSELEFSVDHNNDRKSILLYDDINFEEIDEDLAAFQEDEMVQQALHRGVDLKKYGNELERDLRQVLLLLISPSLTV